MVLTDKRLLPIKDMEFTFNKEMEEEIYVLLSIQQILNSNELSKREKKMLEKLKFEILDNFRTQLHCLNPAQIKIAQAFLNGKKMMRDKQNLSLYFLFGFPYWSLKSIPLTHVKQLTLTRRFGSASI